MAGVVLCGICKNASEPFIRIGSYDIRRCPRCRHSFVHPTPSRSRIDEFYDSEEDEFWNVGGIPLVRRYLENRLLFWDYYERIRYKPLKKALPHFQSDWKVLDVGCSSSLFLLERETLQGEQRANYGLAHPLGFLLGLGPHAAVDREPRMLPGENPLRPFRAEKLPPDEKS